MEQNYFEHLKNIVKAGEFLIENHKNKEGEGWEKITLISLIRIEGLLDTGRNLVGIENYGEGGLAEINKRMDTIRNEIVVLMREIGKEGVERSLESASFNLKTRFVEGLWKE